MALKSRLFKQNLLWQGLGQGGGKLLTLGFYLYLPRLIGLTAYGQFSYGLALATILLQPLMEMGLDLVIIKQVSRGDASIIKAALLLRGAMILLALGCLPLIARLFQFPGSILIGLYLYLVLLAVQKLCFARQRGVEAMALEGGAVCLQRGLVLACLWLFSRQGLAPQLLGPTALAVGTGIVTIGVIGACWPWLNQAVQYPYQDLRLRETAQESLLLGGTALLGLIYFRIDSLMLGLLSGDLAVGHYNLAYRLLEGLIFLPSLVMAVGFPRLSRWQSFADTFQRLFWLLSAIGGLICAVIAAGAPMIITTLYGTDSGEAAQILRILAFTFLPICWGHLGTQALVALDQQRFYLGLTLLATGLNIGLNGLMIPHIGATGAAVATCATESLVALICFYQVWRIHPLNLWPLGSDSD